MGAVRKIGKQKMKEDIKRILITSMVEKAFRDGKSSPRRTARNMIDLGLNFSKGRFQKRFLTYAQEMLQDQESAYYDLVTDVIAHTDEKLLINFGMNLGYNGCTKGAAVIRKMEKEQGFNIPWCLSMKMDGKRMEQEADVCQEWIRQGKEQGIYVYLMALKEGNPEGLLKFLKMNPDCAFIFFLGGQTVSEGFAKGVRECGNAMISVPARPDSVDNCWSMRKNRLLYAVHAGYREADAGRILDDTWLKEQLLLHPQFAFVWADWECESDIRQKVYEHVVDVRMKQKYPVLYMEIREDLQMIDNIISDDACAVGFETDGSVVAYARQTRMKVKDIGGRTLKEILKIMVPKDITEDVAADIPMEIP